MGDLIKAFCFLLPLLASGVFADEIVIGVPNTLTGDGAQAGEDINHALSLANEILGDGRYRLIFEDDKCENKQAVSIANKLIHVDKIRYALGFFCNSTLLATANIYDRAKVTVITSSANSGDVLDIGSHIFRLFPADTGCAEKLYSSISKDRRQLAILTEQNEYSVMMDRTVHLANDRSKNPMSIQSLEYVHGQTDLRTLVLKVRNSEAVFVNANTEPSFLSVMKQLHQQNYRGAVYSAYFGSSAAIRDSLGSLANDLRFCSLSAVDELVSEKGKFLMSEFRKRFGEPKSGFPVVPSAFESFRLLDEAIRSGSTAESYLRNREVRNGFIPPYRFDEHGAVQGINFQMQEIKGGKVVVLP